MPLLSSFRFGIKMKKSDAGRPVGLPHRFSSFIRRRPGTNLGRRPKTHRDLVHWERSHKVLRDFVHQARAPGGPKTLRDLVHRERRYKVLRVIVHQVRAAGRSKTHRELVQKERRYKVLRVIVHQVRAGGRPKTHRDLAHRERRNKGLRVIVHQVLSRRFRSKPDDNKCVLKGNFFCGTVGAQRGGAANTTRADCRRRRRTDPGGW